MTLDIEGVLADHGEVWQDVAMHGWACRCDQWPDDDIRHTEADYRAHVAAVLREQIAAWLVSEGTIVSSMQVLKPVVEDRRYHGLRIEDPEVYARATLAALAAQVAPSRVPGGES